MATRIWIGTSSTAFDTAGNWSPSGAPANNDTLVFNHQATANCATNLSTTLTGVTLIVEKSFTKYIGDGTNYLVLDGGTMYVRKASGSGSPAGSGRIMVNFGSTAATAYIEDSAQTSADTYYPPIQLLGTSLTVQASGGSYGIAIRPGEVSTATAVKQTADSEAVVSAGGYLGTGLTLTAATLNAGTLRNRSDQTATTVTVANAAATYEATGAGAHTTINCYAGHVNYEGGGNITTLNLAGTFKRTRDTRAITISTTNIYTGSTVDIDNGAGGVTMTTKNLINCGMQDVTWNTSEGVLL